MIINVCAIIPAFQRPKLLQRALDSLQGQGTALTGAVVVNNSGDSEITRVAKNASIQATVLQPGANLGTAGGIGFGMQHALRNPAVTHVWVMDDDAFAAPSALNAMCGALTAVDAECVAPLVIDETGRVRWFPCPLPQPAWNVIRQKPTPEEFLKQCGPHPYQWSWAIWASILISRHAIEAVGYPRIDLWSQFSDLEYTLRISAKFKCVLAPKAVCTHSLQEPSGPPPFKLFAAIQSASYVSVRLSHGRRALRHLPGLCYRYLRHFQWRTRAWFDLLRAFTRGAIAGRTPADYELKKEFHRAAAIFPQWNNIPSSKLRERE